MENVATEEFISRTEALKDFESCTARGELMDCCEAAEYKYCPYCAKRIV